MKKDFITIKFVTDKENEKDRLKKIRENLPVALSIARRNESFDGHTYEDPFSQENKDKIGYIIRIRKEIYKPKKADIQTHNLVFNRTDIKKEVADLWDKYKIEEYESNNSVFGYLVDLSYAAIHFEEFISELKTIFSKLNLKKELWEDFFYYAIGEKYITDKYQSTPKVNVFALARLENGEIEYHFNMDKDATKDDLTRQYSAFASLTRELGNKQNRIKPAFDKYNKVNEVLTLQSIHTYDDPETKEEIIEDTTLEEKLEHVFGENEDSDNSKQIDHLKKLEKRLKDTGQ